MAADVVDDVGDLLVAHHGADRRHAVQAVQHHGERIAGSGELLVIGERRIVAGALRAAAVLHVAPLTDAGVQRFAALLGEGSAGGEGGG